MVVNPKDVCGNGSCNWTGSAFNRPACDYGLPILAWRQKKKKRGFSWRQGWLNNAVNSRRKWDSNLFRILFITKREENRLFRPSIMDPNNPHLGFICIFLLPNALSSESIELILVKFFSLSCFVFVFVFFNNATKNKVHHTFAWCDSLMGRIKSIQVIFKHLITSKCCSLSFTKCPGLTPTDVFFPF